MTGSKKKRILVNEDLTPPKIKGRDAKVSCYFAYYYQDFEEADMYNGDVLYDIIKWCREIFPQHKKNMIDCDLLGYQTEEVLIEIMLMKAQLRELVNGKKIVFNDAKETKDKSSMSKSA